jgi:4-amino-4-deoxy-L-arabinose transferase-like glycosyltransferase
VNPFTARQASVAFLLYCLLAVILRFFSFFPSVIDHDESTYLEISRMLLNGKTLYVDMIDIKPPGIFLIIAGFQAVFGYSIFVMRLLLALWVAVTAFIIYKTAKVLITDEKASLASGIVYIFFVSTWSYFGISITPEIFFNLFTISALYVLLRKQNLINYLWAGLLAGLGFIVKYFVIFDFTAIIAFIVILNYFKKGNLQTIKATFSLFIAGMGFFIPFALINLWYYLNGHFDDFYNIVYLAPSRYAVTFYPWNMFKYIIDFLVHFIPVFFLFFYVLIDKKFRRPEISLLKKLCVPWSLLALFAVLISGKRFGHYTIQLMLPISLMTGVFFHSARSYPAFLSPMKNRKTGRYILAFLILIIAMLKLEYVIRKDVPREIAAYLEPKVKAEDVIYTANYHHVIYYLLQKESPTKYVHRTLLLGPTHIKALDIDIDAEFRQIMAKRPVYIIVNKRYPDGMMKDFIDANYTVEKEFADGAVLFGLKENK